MGWSMLTKVYLSGRLSANGPVAIVVGIEVPLQDLVLGVEARDLERQDGLFDLARIRDLVAFFLGNQDILDQLHRNRATTLDALPL
jgi:hypothetical protein